MIFTIDAWKSDPSLWLIPAELKTPAFSFVKLWHSAFYYHMHLPYEAPDDGFGHYITGFLGNVLHNLKKHPEATLYLQVPPDQTEDNCSALYKVKSVYREFSTLLYIAELDCGECMWLSTDGLCDAINCESASKELVWTNYEEIAGKKSTKE